MGALLRSVSLEIWARGSAGSLETWETLFWRLPREPAEAAHSALSLKRLRKKPCRQTQLEKYNALFKRMHENSVHLRGAQTHCSQILGLVTEAYTPQMGNRKFKMIRPDRRTYTLTKAWENTDLKDGCCGRELPQLRKVAEKSDFRK